MCNSGVYNQTAKYDPFNNANSGWSCLSSGLSGTNIEPFCCDVNIIWQSGSNNAFNSYNQESALMVTPRDSGKYTFTSQRQFGYTIVHRFNCLRTNQNRNLSVSKNRPRESSL